MTSRLAKEAVFKMGIDNGIDYIFKDFEKQFSNITRVEVVGKNGREFTKLIKTGKYIIMLQDDNRTLKLFEEIEWLKKKYTLRYR